MRHELDGDSQGMKKGESPCHVVRKDTERISPFGVWMFLVTIAAATWGYSSPTPRGCCRCFLRAWLCNVLRDAALRNKVSLVRSGVRQCREINVKLAAIQIQRRVASLACVVRITMSTLYRETSTVSVDIISQGNIVYFCLEFDFS